jgi:hypothetical protein
MRASGYATDFDCFLTSGHHAYCISFAGLGVQQQPLIQQLLWIPISITTDTPLLHDTGHLRPAAIVIRAGFEALEAALLPAFRCLMTVPVGGDAKEPDVEGSHTGDFARVIGGAVDREAVRTYKPVIEKHFEFKVAHIG